MDEREFPPTYDKMGWLWWLGLGGLVFLLHALLFPAISDGPTPESRQRNRARNDEDKLVTALKYHYIEYQQAPSGSHAEIIHTLRGNNPRKVVFLELGPKELNPAGEFIDPWGMPYRINTSEPRWPKIYSTGPDKRDDSAATDSDDIPSWR